MNPKVSVSPRKNPKQERSQSLVGSIVEATTRILDRYGYAKISTNRVAELAGVSIGSLYQYFPGKDSLMAAVLERQVKKNMSRFEEQVKAQAGRPARERVEALISSTVDFYLDNGKVSRELFLHGIHPQKVNFVLSMRRRAVKVVSEIVSTEGTGSRKNAGVRAYVVVNSIVGVILTSLLDEETPLDRPGMVAELTDLVINYLKI